MRVIRLSIVRSRDVSMGFADVCVKISNLKLLLMQVAAACIYCMCREEHQPFMLIDFSDALQASSIVCVVLAKFRSADVQAVV